MSLANRISEIREAKGISIDRLSELSGVPKSTLSKISAGITLNPSLDTVKAIASALSCKLDDFDDTATNADIVSQSELNHIDKYRALDKHGRTVIDFILDTEYQRMQDLLIEDEEAATYDIPLLGKTAAGAPLAYSDPSYDAVAVHSIPHGAEFALYVSGDSMEPVIKNGSIVFVKPQPVAETGEIVIAEINGSSVTCKKFHKDEDGEIELRSINPKYDPITNFESLRIIGKVIL